MAAFRNGAVYALIAVAVFQTVLVTYAIVEIVDLERNVEMLAATVAENGAESKATPILPSADAGIDESRLRTVIRQELAGRAAVPAAQAVSTAALRRSTPDEIGMVEARLAGVVSAGAIDQRELDRVQVEIAKLDPAARRSMFTRLTRAINSGQVKIRIN